MSREGAARGRLGRPPAASLAVLAWVGCAAADPPLKLVQTMLFDAETSRLYLVVLRLEGKDRPEIQVYQAP